MAKGDYKISFIERPRLISEMLKDEGGGCLKWVKYNMMDLVVF